MFVCTMCGCHECTELGALGYNTWVRCRDCGWDSVLNDAELEEVA